MNNDETIFRKLKIGDSFKYFTQTLRKIETVYKGCCLPDYNSEEVGNEENKLLVPDTAKVTKLC